MFKTIILTMPIFLDHEAERMAAMLHDGKADIIHIRKPEAEADRVEWLLRAIPCECYPRIVLHDHFELAVRYGLYGVHLNSRNPQPPEGWRGSISRSCHSLHEVEEWKGRCSYVSLSPIFDSVSKEGYKSAFKEEEIREAVGKGIIDNKTYALGGVTFKSLKKVEEMGFGGAMILGDAWR